ncbi:MAG: LysM peptidoglycan-binding domain-containing protein [Planctomycetota bacterium]
MSTIRPIVTIVLLAMVGVFLYVRMTAKEPELPQDLAGWDVASELSIGGPPSLEMGGLAGPGAMPDTSELPPAFNASPAPAGPAFAEAAAGEAPPAFVPDEAPQFDSAPTFSPEAPPSSEPAPGGGVPVAVGIGVAPAYPDPPSAAPPVAQAPAVELAPPPAENTPTPPAGDRYGTQTSTAPQAPPALEEPPVTPTEPAGSLFASTRVAAQSALDRGELSQALLLLSDWYGDPSLSPGEEQELGTLLSQLAGSVIYSTEHRLEPPYRVQAGQRLQDIAQEYNVPWQLLAKINGVEDPAGLTPGSELKVVRGPFEAVVDFNRRTMTLMLQRRYAGRFELDIEPGTSVEDGLWTVDQKLLTPSAAGPVYSTGSSEERSLMLTNPVAGGGQVAIVRGPSAPGAASADPPGRVVRLSPGDMEDLFDIVSVGSRVVIRR